MSILRKIWEGWKFLAAWIGGVISTVILTIFYFLILPLFAVPFRLFGKSLLKRQYENSNWVTRDKTPSTLEDFKEEF